MSVAESNCPAEDLGRQLLAEHSAKELLRFITCGSVDDGKSTLIGRLLLEVGAIYEDQIAALRRDTEKHGTTDGELDTALLLDGLEDERQQGITIDVAYRYFSTSRRKFIIADTPGHEQFTRNMATGASTADLALILVDASKGIRTQTKRHAFIVSLLGIQHVVLAVNKMDLVDFSQEVFEQICEEFRQFAAKLEIPDIRFVPLSALKGDNVVAPSANTLWYTEGSLLNVLENVYVGGDRNRRDFRFPVQWVNRPDSSFRGYSGTIASGTVRVGDPILVLPSKKRSQVARIVTRDGELVEASAPQSVTLTLEDETDVARGDMLVRPENRPHVSREADAMVVWMSEQPLVPGKLYWVKHTTRKTSGEVADVRYTIDVNTLHRSPASTLRLNEVGRCRVSLHDPVMFDAYRRNRETGAFVMVDRITHETVAAGMLLDLDSDTRQADYWNPSSNSLLLQPFVSQVDAAERARRLQQQPLTILISGLSGSGKTTLASGLEKYLFDQGKKPVVLDGQQLRLGISRDLGFSSEERSENLRRAAEIAKLINDAGLICIAAFVAPHEQVRQRVRQLIGPSRLIHLHLSASVAVCRQRDATGRYLAAVRNEISDFPGITAPYSDPQDADLVISTESCTAEQALRQAIDFLADRLNEG